MLRQFLFLVGVSVLALGCSSAHKKHGKHKGQPAYYAAAVLKSVGSNKASGEVHFAEGFGHVKVTAKLKGLPPNSEHGFHIHEFGDCRAADASTAGGHYNPSGHEHAAPAADKRHAGDLGNVKSNAKGEATLELEMKNISLNGKTSPIVGRGVILHKNPDDLVTQPTGGAGDRIACGVIGIVEKL